MAPSPILGRYKLYKEGTKKFVQWLAQAASTCCDLSTIVKALDASHTTITESAHIGKKSNTASRKSRPSGHRPPPENHVVTITTREISQLVQVVHDEPTLPIPGDILEVLKDVVGGREECSAWYAGRSAPEGSEVDSQNSTHLYFIEVLRSSYAVLTSVEATRIRAKAPVTRTASKKQKAKQETGELDALNNLFEHLRVEEPSEQPLGTGLEMPKPTNSVDQESRAGEAPRYCLEEDNDTAAFQLWCFLEDMNDVRTFIRETWKEYTRGEVSVVAAGLVTNTGFTLMRQANEELVRAHPAFHEYWQIHKFLKVRLVTNPGAAALMPIDAGAHRKQVRSSANPAAVLCTSGAVAIHWMHEPMNATWEAADATECSQIPQQLRRQMKPGISVIRARARPPHEDPFNQFPRQRFVDLLVQVAPELQHFRAFVSKFGREAGTWTGDELVYGLMQYARGKESEVPIWLAAAAQTYIDIFDVLGGQMDIAAIAVSDRIREYDKIVQRHREFLEALPGDTAKLDWTEDFDSLFVEQMPDQIDWLRGRHDSDWVRTEPKFSGPPSLPVQSVHELPTIGCEILRRWQFIMANHGSNIINRRSHVLVMAHLYKACRYYGLVPEWHDMEFVCANHSGKQPLVTKTHANADPHAIARHYQMALGVPASAYSSASDKKRRARITRTHLEKARYFSPKLVLAKGISKASFQHMDRHSDFDWDLVISAALQAIADAEMDKSGAGTRRRDVACTPVGLLTTFKKHYISDEPAMNFDYITFHQTCFLAQRDMFVKFHQQSSLPGLKDNMLAFEMADAVLWESADAIASGTLPLRTALGHVAATIKLIIAEGGNDFSKQAYSMSSGRIPKNLRPSIVSRDRCFPHTYDVFQRECIGRLKNWSYESWMPDGPIYQPQGTPEGLERLARIKRLLDLWDTNLWKVDEPSHRAAGFWAMDIMKTNLMKWANNGFQRDGIPAEFVAVVAADFRGTSVEEAFNNARTWLLETIFGDV